jgi:hypothetical protein
MADKRNVAKRSVIQGGRTFRGVRDHETENLFMTNFMQIIIVFMKEFFREIITTSICYVRKYAIDTILHAIFILWENNYRAKLICYLPKQY